MKRREFFARLGAAGAYAMVPRLALAQQGTRVRRVAMLLGNENRATTTALAMLRNELAKLDWVEGRNLQIDVRFGRGDPDRLTAAAEELVKLRPDVIFVLDGPTGVAVQQRTSVIPIVFVGGGDPATNGLVRNIARPEGNMTGFANNFGSLGGRWLELFKEAVPRLTRVADIVGPPSLLRAPIADSIAAAAAQLRVTIIRMPVRNAVDIGPAISAFAAEPNSGLLETGATPVASFEAIARLALYHHLPLIHGGASFNARREGVLMAYGPDASDLLRRASSYVDRILRGAKPSELPVQYPTKFELVVNLKTAKAIGVTIPEAFLAQAGRPSWPAWPLVTSRELISKPGPN